jgi:hypothetical protein
LSRPRPSVLAAPSSRPPIMMPHPVRVIITARSALPMVYFGLSFFPEEENHEDVEDEEEREEIQEEGYDEEHVKLIDKGVVLE